MKHPLNIGVCGRHDKWTLKVEEVMEEKFQQQIHPCILLFPVWLNSATSWGCVSTRVHQETHQIRHLKCFFIYFFKDLLFISLCAKCAGTHSQKLEEGVRDPGAGVTCPH